MEDKASGDELGKNQESNTVIYGKEIKISGKSEVKQQKSEQNKEDSEQLIKDKRQFEENVTERITIHEFQGIKTMKMKLTPTKS